MGNITKVKSHERRALELIHTDVCGPMKTTSIGGGRYFVSFRDDKTRKSYTYIMKEKSEVLTRLKQFLMEVENELNLTVTMIRCDGGGEYVNREMKHFLIEKGIRLQVTARNSPEQNGVAERLNRTLMEKTRCILAESGLTKEFWGEALNTATYLQNVSPTQALDGKTPHEV